MAITKTDSEVEICNIALVKMGSRKQIEALGEAGIEGESFAFMYPHQRDKMLTSHPWNFAIKRSQLSSDTTAPAFQYANQYHLPSDYLRAVKLYNTHEKWIVESDRLLTDASPANLVYIARITDVTKFSPLFQEALAADLAAEMSLTINSDGTKSNLLRQQADKLIREAKRRDGQEGIPDFLQAEGFTGPKRTNYWWGQD